MVNLVDIIKHFNNSILTCCDSLQGIHDAADAAGNAGTAAGTAAGGDRL